MLTLISGDELAWVYEECDPERCEACVGAYNDGLYVSYNNGNEGWDGGYWLWRAEDKNGATQHLCHECFGWAVGGLLESRQNEHANESIT